MITISDESRIVPNFTFKEMASRGELIMNPEIVIFMQMAQELRDWLVKTYPIYTNDGIIVSNIYRTPKHNAEVGGAVNSCHLDSRAFDMININTKDEDLVQMLKIAWQVICVIRKKIGGIEIGKDYMHFDNYSDKFGVKTFRLVDKR